MRYQDRITVEPGKRGGKPCIRGLRIAVSDVLGWLAAGRSTSEILEDTPELEIDDIRASLAFAAAREHKRSGAARDGAFVIVSNDAGFADLSAVHGAPPHVVWLRAGNPDKAQMLAILMKHREALDESFHRDGKALVEILG